MERLRVGPGAVSLSCIVVYQRNGTGENNEKRNDMDQQTKWQPIHVLASLVQLVSSKYWARELPGSVSGSNVSVPTIAAWVPTGKTIAAARGVSCVRARCAGVARGLRLAARGTVMGLDICSLIRLVRHAGRREVGTVKQGTGGKQNHDAVIYNPLIVFVTVYYCTAW